MAVDVMQQIVAFLNAEGGVLLIGCKKGPTEEIYADVERMSESMK